MQNVRVAQLISKEINAQWVSRAIYLTDQTCKAGTGFKSDLRRKNLYNDKKMELFKAI